jgi:hypothetical protein
MEPDASNGPVTGQYRQFYGTFAGFGTGSIKTPSLFLSSGNKICASGNTFYALTWFCNANSRTELGMVRELKSRQSDGAAK